MSNFLEDHARRSNVDRKAKFAENCGKVSSISPVVWLALCPLSSLTSKPKWVSGRRRQYGKIPLKRSWYLKVSMKVLLNVNAWLQLISKLILLRLNCYCNTQDPKWTKFVFSRLGIADLTEIICNPWACPASTLFSPAGFVQWPFLQLLGSSHSGWERNRGSFEATRTVESTVDPTRVLA